MNRLVGTLLMVLLLYGAVMAADETARTPLTHQLMARQLGKEGILALGVAPVIITGGIDLSIGAVVGLSQIGFVLLLEAGLGPLAAAGAVLLLAPLIGLVHGLLITRLRLQSFLVTLCGLFIYRGLAQWFTSFKTGEPRSVGIASSGADVSLLKFWVTGNFEGFPCILVPLLAVAAIAALILHFSVPGRYLYAIGSNEQAARYAGIDTDRYKIAAYMWCSLLAGLGGIMYMLEVGTADGLTAGQWLELYAITGAVLGGCSLRGGEGSIPGVLMGMAFLPLLRNLCTFANIPDKLQFPVFGLALLIGTIVDEVLKRRAARKVS